MVGYFAGFHTAVLVGAQQELKYQQLCEKAKAEGRDPPSREDFFGPPTNWEPTESMVKPASYKSSDWWPLWLVALCGDG